MSFLNRFMGVFLNPKDTFKALSEKPRWVDALILILIATLVYFFIVGPYLQQDQIKAFESNIKLKEMIGEKAFNERLEFLKNPPQFMIVIGTVMQPVSVVIGFLIASLILLGLGRMTSTEGRYVQVFSAVTHASFINLILGNALRVFLVLSRKSVLQTTTSAALFFPKLEVTSSAFIALSQVDFFQLWLYGALGYALSSIFKIDVKKGMILSYSFWFLKSLFYIGLGLLNMRFGG
ncbi:MAG: YIP1 family protein [Candidatus Aminicenantales bacterium]